MIGAIIIFVRNPQKGKVKTRLAATMGEEKALDIYLQLLHHTAAITSKARDVSRYVFYNETIVQHDLWAGETFHKLLQEEGDLGHKMWAAFSKVFAHGHEKVLIIGSDCPGLTTEGIEAAFEALSCHDVVIGPAHDGGYYLLGLKAIHKEFFMDKAWSTDSVYNATLGDISALGLSYYALPTLTDIDTEEDWNRVKAQSAQ